MGEDLESGRLRPEEATKERTSEEYTAGVVRAFAALAELGAVTDLGDFPPLVAVKPGELPRPDPTAADPTEADPTGAGGGAAGRGRRRRRRPRAAVRPPATGCAAASSASSASTPTCRGRRRLPRPGPRPGRDVAAAGRPPRPGPPRRVRRPVRPPRHRARGPRRRRRLPGFVVAVAGKASARTPSRARWTTSSPTTPRAPTPSSPTTSASPSPTAAARPGNRCSTCWDVGDRPGGSPPSRSRWRPRSLDLPGRAPTPRVARRLDERVYRLVWDVYRGVHLRDLFRALRGEETYFHAAHEGVAGWARPDELPPLRVDAGRDQGRPRRLPRPARRRREGRQGGTRWRDAAHARRQEAKAAKAAAASEGSSP